MDEHNALGSAELIYSFKSENPFLTNKMSAEKRIIEKGKQDSTESGEHRINSRIDVFPRKNKQNPFSFIYNMAVVLDARVPLSERGSMVEYGSIKPVQMG